MKAAWTLVLAFGCGADHGSTPHDGGGGLSTILTMPGAPNHDLDLLFMIDDSQSTAAFQQNLATNFPAFINVLSALPGGLPNLHLGVITSDMGTTSSGSAAAPPIGQVGNGGCAGIGKGGVLQTSGAPVTGAFLSDIALPDGSRQRNYTGTLTDAFATMAKVGSGGCGFEQPLAAMRAALDPANTANAGFLRPEAILGVVFVTDEDDCSAKDASLFDANTAALGPLQSFRCTRFGVRCVTGGTTPDEMNLVGVKDLCGTATASTVIDDAVPFAGFLRSAKPVDQMLFVAEIAGPPEPFAVELRTPPGGGTALSALVHSCEFTDAAGQLAVADPAVRMKAFLDEFQNRAAFDTVCQNDLSGAFGKVGDLVTNAVGSPCIAVPLPATPDCVVEELSGDVATAIPPCPASPTCWHIDADAATCPGTDHLKLVVDRAEPGSVFSTITLSCRI